jgi:hypothetical protein
MPAITRLTRIAAACAAVGALLAGADTATATGLETSIAVYGPYQLTAEPLGVRAVLSWISGTEPCGYGACHSYSPVAGRTLHFYARTAPTVELCSAVTGEDGSARCGSTAEKLAAIRGEGLTVVFLGDDTYRSSSATRASNF